MFSKMYEYRLRSIICVAQLVNDIDSDVFHLKL